MTDPRFADRRRTAIGANGDVVPEVAPALRRADTGAETQRVSGERSLPLTDRRVQHGVGWLRQHKPIQASLTGVLQMAP